MLMMRDSECKSGGGPGDRTQLERFNKPSQYPDMPVPLAFWGRGRGLNPRHYAYETYAHAKASPHLFSCVWLGREGSNLRLPYEGLVSNSHAIYQLMYTRMSTSIASPGKTKKEAEERFLGLSFSLVCYVSLTGEFTKETHGIHMIHHIEVLHDLFSLVFVEFRPVSIMTTPTLFVKAGSGFLNLKGNQYDHLFLRLLKTIDVHNGRKLNDRID